MATKLVMKVEGLRELSANLRSLGEEMAGAISIAATGTAAALVMARAIELAPKAEPEKFYFLIVNKVPPGNLKRSIYIKHLPKKKKTYTEYMVGVRAGKKAYFASRYGSMLEYGTVKMDAQPFMRPAFEQEKERAKDVMLEVVKRAIEGVRNYKGPEIPMGFSGPKVRRRGK